MVELFGDIDKRPFKGLGEGAEEANDYTIVVEKADLLRRVERAFCMAISLHGLLWPCNPINEYSHYV